MDGLRAGRPGGQSARKEAALRSLRSRSARTAGDCACRPGSTPPGHVRTPDWVPARCSVIPNQYKEVMHQASAVVQTQRFCSPERTPEAGAGPLTPTAGSLCVQLTATRSFQSVSPSS